ncbi:uncharacterized protein LOC143843920 [Paroedura picta]|uniref:uncharacterized protein LOC143843920 n=1 Tax=Paroedura picta TaxID=143630 RepID=UPI004057ACB4
MAVPRQGNPIVGMGMDSDIPEVKQISSQWSGKRTSRWAIPATYSRNQDFFPPISFLAGGTLASPAYSLEGQILKMKLKYFCHLMRRKDSLEKSLMLGAIERKRRGRQRMRWTNRQ